MTTSSKLRIGFFAQHQVDELYVDETPIQHHDARLRPAEGPARLACPPGRVWPERGIRRRPRSDVCQVDKKRVFRCC